MTAVLWRHISEYGVFIQAALYSQKHKAASDMKLYLIKINVSYLFSIKDESHVTVASDPCVYIYCYTFKYLQLSFFFGSQLVILKLYRFNNVRGKNINLFRVKS
jgi:hypothetical protein